MTVPRRRRTTPLEEKLARMKPPGEAVIGPRFVRTSSLPTCPACCRAHRPSEAKPDRWTRCRGCSEWLWVHFVHGSLFPWFCSLDGPSFTLTTDEVGGGEQ